MAEVDESIPLLCLCGNHDVGNRPNSAAIDLFRARFGPDYFVFWVGGVRGIVINSQLYKDSSLCPDLAAAQDAWLTEELAKPPTFTIVFSHIPPFIETAGEPSGYFNLDPEIRASLLARMHKGGVRAWFCGHYHRNMLCADGDLEVIISSAVGTTLRPKGTDVLGLDGFCDPDCGPHTSGLRIVKVHENAVHHQWFTMGAVPEAVDPSSVTW